MAATGFCARVAGLCGGLHLEQDQEAQGRTEPHFTDPRQIQLLTLPDADLAWHVRAWDAGAERAAGIGGPLSDGGWRATVAYLWRGTRVTRRQLDESALKTFGCAEERATCCFVANSLPMDWA